MHFPEYQLLPYEFNFGIESKSTFRVYAKSNSVGRVDPSFANKNCTSIFSTIQIKYATVNQEVIVYLHFKAPSKRF